MHPQNTHTASMHEHLLNQKRKTYSGHHKISAFTSHTLNIHTGPVQALCPALLAWLSSLALGLRLWLRAQPCPGTELGLAEGESFMPFPVLCICVLRRLEPVTGGCWRQGLLTAGFVWRQGSKSVWHRQWCYHGTMVVLPWRVGPSSWRLRSGWRGWWTPWACVRQSARRRPSASPPSGGSRRTWSRIPPGPPHTHTQMRRHIHTHIHRRNQTDTLCCS